MSFLESAVTVEIVLTLILLLLALFFVLTREKEILSQRGMEKLWKNRNTIRMGIFFSLLSVFFYLQGEASEIASTLFPSQFGEVISFVHIYSETLHLFLLILGLTYFLFVLIRVSDLDG